jgi:hypothetical protein
MRKAWAWFRWPYVAVFFAGAVGGATAATILVGRAWQQQFASQYMIQVADQANVAREIYAGNAGELAERIRSGLPTYVKTIEVEFPRADQREWALCMGGRRISGVWAAGTHGGANGSFQPPVSKVSRMGLRGAKKPANNQMQLTSGAARMDAALAADLGVSRL